MRMMVMIIYLLFLICMIVYYGKMMYRNYQKELPLGYGQNKIVYFMILLCIIIGQYTIPSAWGRLSVILIFGVAFFLIYAMIGSIIERIIPENYFAYIKKKSPQQRGVSS